MNLNIDNIDENLINLINKNLVDTKWNDKILGEDRPRLHQQKFKLGKQSLWKMIFRNSEMSHMWIVIFVARSTLTTVYEASSKPILQNWTQRISWS